MTVELTIDRIDGYSSYRQLAEVSAPTLDDALSQVGDMLDASPSEPLSISMKGRLTRDEQTLIASKVRIDPDGDPPPWIGEFLGDLCGYVESFDWGADMGEMLEVHVAIGDDHWQAMRSPEGDIRLIPHGCSAHLWERTWISFCHWHPGSHASGMCTEMIGLLAPRVEASLTRMEGDEDWLSLGRAPDDDRTLAELLIRFAAQADMRGGGTYLLAAYVHGVFSAKTIEDFVPLDWFSDANPGYAIGAIFSVPDSVLPYLAGDERLAWGREVLDASSSQHAVLKAKMIDAHERGLRPPPPEEWVERFDAGTGGIDVEDETTVFVYGSLEGDGPCVLRLATAERLMAEQSDCASSATVGEYLERCRQQPGRYDPSWVEELAEYFEAVDVPLDAPFSADLLPGADEDGFPADLRTVMLDDLPEEVFEAGIGEVRDEMGAAPMFLLEDDDLPAIIELLVGLGHEVHNGQELLDRM
jgi:hypothetical protein